MSGDIFDSHDKIGTATGILLEKGRNVSKYCSMHRTVPHHQ
jgi:hypothetical protein